MKIQLGIQRFIFGVVLAGIFFFVTPVEWMNGFGVVEASRAQLNYTEKSLLKGESFQLLVQNQQAVKFSSSNRSVATVSKKGIVTGKKRGTAVIQVQLNNARVLSCRVQVNSQVDLIIFAGQSNMTGAGGEVQGEPLLDGAGYECKIITNPSELRPIVEPFGKDQDNEIMNDAPYRYGSLVTAFVNSYYQQTGVPVVGVSATAVGTNSDLWNRIYAGEVARRANIAKQTLKQKGIKVRHCYLVFFQGEADAMEGFSPEQYTSNVTRFVRKVKVQAGAEKCFLIRIGYMQSSPSLFDEIVEAQTSLCKTNKQFVLVSTKAATLGAKYYRADGLHLNQVGLDVIGKEAGKYAGRYVVTGKEPGFFDKKYNKKYKSLCN